MKLLLCDAGSNQKALAHKIHAKFKLDGIIVVNPKARKTNKKKFKVFITVLLKSSVLIEKDPLTPSLPIKKEPFISQPSNLFFNFIFVSSMLLSFKNL